MTPAAPNVLTAAFCRNCVYHGHDKRNRTDCHEYQPDQKNAGIKTLEEAAAAVYKTQIFDPPDTPDNPGYEQNYDYDRQRQRDGEIEHLNFRRFSLSQAQSVSPQNLPMSQTAAAIATMTAQRIRGPFT